MKLCSRLSLETGGLHCRNGAVGASCIFAASPAAQRCVGRSAGRCKHKPTRVTRTG